MTDQEMLMVAAYHQPAGGTKWTRMKYPRRVWKNGDIGQVLTQQHHLTYLELRFTDGSGLRYKRVFVEQEDT